MISGILFLSYVADKSIKLINKELKDLKHNRKKTLKILFERNDFALDVMKKEVLKHNGNDDAFLKRIEDYQRLLNVVYDFEKLEDAEDAEIDKM